ncbi:hypothetical protein [Janibacter melonis]|uniref:hypothetical protein n=1 Tax=Janibacter melonis TaxID=262209 RepID=UPI00174A44D0|nr:hypothetical protein [Janibacter melonis]
MKEAIPWIELIATLCLLGVTAWYAVITKGMADSARKSAQASERSTAAAERSAQAALDAATVAQSQIRPEFTGRWVNLTGDEGYVACIRIDSTGDAVVVQGVRIRRAFRKSWDEGNRVVAVEDADLTVAGLDSALPKRLHYGEHLLLTHPDIQDARSDPFTRFLIDIDYTFSVSGGAGATKELIVDMPSHPSSP